MDDAAMVRACLEGRQEAWAALLDRHGALLKNLVDRRLSGRPGADPDAVFQEFWMALLERDGRRLRLADPARPLLPYLAAIALGLCRQHLAKLARERKGQASLTPLSEADPAQGPFEGLASLETIDHAKAAVEALPPKERLAIALVVTRGLSYAQAGRVLGMAEGSVGALLTRARERLKEIAKTVQGKDPEAP